MIEKKVRERGHNVTYEFMTHLDEFNENLNITLKAHLFIEKTMNEVLDKMMDTEVLGRIGFKPRLNILYAFGLIEKSTFEAAREFNNIRNDYGHKYDYQIDEETLNKLKSKLSNDNLEAYRTLVENEEFKYLFEGNFNLKYKTILTFIMQDIYRVKELFFIEFRKIAKNILNEVQEDLDKTLKEEGRE